MIDWDKPYETRDGRKVLIYTTESRISPYPVRGEVHFKGSIWHAGSWTSEGEWITGGGEMPEGDLVNIPQKHTVTINVNRRNGQHQMYLCVHGSREEADDQASGHRIACIEVTFTEGEGL